MRLFIGLHNGMGSWGTIEPGYLMMGGVCICLALYIILSKGDHPFLGMASFGEQTLFGLPFLKQVWD